MKDTEIHKGLENKEIRDFLAKSLVDAQSYEQLQQRPYEKSNEWLIENQRTIIKNAETEIKRLETFKAVAVLAEKFGYSEFDVSDYVQKTGKFWRSFFGTENEYDNFILFFQSN